MKHVMSGISVHRQVFLLFFFSLYKFSLLYSIIIASFEFKLDNTKKSKYQLII